MKIGIFGGAFDPLHLEHIRIIEESIAALSLDKLILLLSYSPPHKNCRISAFEDRLEMLKTIKDSRVIIDKREYNNKVGRNCSYEILQSLKNDYKDDELVYIIGGDSLENFHTWVHPEIVAKIMPIAVIPREGYADSEKKAEEVSIRYGAEIKIMPFLGKAVSSSIIKAHYEVGLISDDVSNEVSEIIKSRGLYRYYTGIVDKLKSELSPSRYHHSVSTMLYAVSFATKLHLDYDKVFLASLLHDCGKGKTPPNGCFNDVPDKIVHQFYGAELAKSEYGVTDEEILDAIRYHTTGKEAMSLLGILVYSADVLEKTRDYIGVDDLRAAFSKSTEEGFFACVCATRDKLLKEGKAVYYLTEECYNYYKNKN